MLKKEDFLFMKNWIGLFFKEVTGEYSLLREFLCYMSLIKEFTDDFLIFIL